jgi:hypothetical protein
VKHEQKLSSLSLNMLKQLLPQLPFSYPNNNVQCRHHRCIEYCLFAMLCQSLILFHIIFLHKIKINRQKKLTVTQHNTNNNELTVATQLYHFFIFILGLFAKQQMNVSCIRDNIEYCKNIYIFLFYFTFL